MTEYKKGDKVVVEIDDEDFQKPKKIKMTVEEKREFVKLKNNFITLYGAIRGVYGYNLYPQLYKRLRKNDHYNADNKAQLEFAKAWEDPSLIEVETPKRYRLKFLNAYIAKSTEDGHFFMITGDKTPPMCISEFSEKELDKMYDSSWYNGIYRELVEE